MNSPIVNRSASEKADHANLDEMTVYPNPGWDQITIGLPAAFTTGVLKIFTLQGEEFMMYHLTTGGIIHLDIASYPAGMYACELRSKDDYWQKKFIKAE